MTEENITDSSDFSSSMENRSICFVCYRPTPNILSMCSRCEAKNKLKRWGVRILYIVSFLLGLGLSYWFCE